MPLTLVATPIGNIKDITLRAVELLKESDCVIGEDLKETSKLLKKSGVPEKEIYLLNEHSKANDIPELVQLCLKKNVVLVSDCGTPNFSDPGWQLIRECRRQKIQITSAPGASCLMTLLSYSSQKIESFYFIGFLPQETTARKNKLNQIKNLNENLILMDTPYRLNQVLEELTETFPDRLGLLGLDLTQETEEVLEDKISNFKLPKSKREFIILIYFRTDS